VTRHRPYAELAGLDELEPARRAAVRDHLAECPACRERLSFTRDVRAAAAALATAGEPPADTLPRVLARRAAGERIILPVNDPDPAPAPTRRRVLLMAISAAALVAAVVAAQLVRRHTHEVVPSPAMDSTRPMSPVGVAMIPGRGPTSVRIAGTGRIRVEALLHDGDELSVRGRGAAVTARFGVDGGGITATELTGGTVEVRIPGGTTTRLFLNDRLELTSDGRTLRAERSGALSDRAALEIPR
jgi:hypothetical protein